MRGASSAPTRKETIPQLPSTASSSPSARICPVNWWAWTSERCHLQASESTFEKAEVAKFWNLLRSSVLRMICGSPAGRPLRSSFNSLPDDLSRGGNRL
jgi:hypothetical protein